jgi:hypothetical protein
MTDTDKFAGFEQHKQQLLDANETTYGQEARARYGDAQVDAANKRFKDMTPEQYEALQDLTSTLNEKLAAAYDGGAGDPAGAAAREVCELHKRWLESYWPAGIYTPAAHRAMAQMYVDDPRFTAYYDTIAPGCAAFLRDAVAAWAK